MKKSFIIFLLFCFITVGCNKDNEIVSSNNESTLTEAEIIAKELQTYINISQPEMAAAFIYDYEQNDWVNDNNGTSCNGYKVESPFIIVCGVYYNLKYLVKYEPGNTLKLYFAH